MIGCTLYTILHVNSHILMCVLSVSTLEAVRESSTATANDPMDSIETIPDAVPTVFTEPPVEEQLAWHTLWPESHKLYGHGNELFSLCCNHAGTLVASSCKVS